VSALASDLSLALDPVLLSRRVGLDPEEWQAEVLRSASRRVLLNCARQSGKSTITALKALHVAVFEPDSLVLLRSPTLVQSQELFRKAVGFFRALGRPVGTEAETTQTLELTNGSRIVSLSGSEDRGRGYSAVRLLVVDEAARVEDAAFFSDRPMLHAERGAIWLLSTPYGARGFFHDAWRSDRWQCFEVPATKVPRHTPAFLAEQQASMGEWWYRQEYGCVFLDAVTSAFDSSSVARALRPDLERTPVLGDEWRTHGAAA
jgi:Terminase large subunit, T4likevirus-type, N-terminal